MLMDSRVLRLFCCCCLVPKPASVLSFQVAEQLLNSNGISQADLRAAEGFVADCKRFLNCV